MPLKFHGRVGMKTTLTNRSLISVSRITTRQNREELSQFILKKIYSIGSLKNVTGGVMFSIKNPLKDALIIGVSSIRIDAREIPLTDVYMSNNGTGMQAGKIDERAPLTFPMGQDIELFVRTQPLSRNTQHHLFISVLSEPYGTLNIASRDAVIETREEQVKIPKNRRADYEPGIVHNRQKFVEDYAGVRLHHVKQYSFDPAVARNNIENFTGVAQVPLGFAGPLMVNGEHARGEFLIPLCTSEGTLLASYNRGMKIINLCGGVTVTVLEDHMQRAPAFVFDSARHSRDFVCWIDEHMDEIRERAESVSNVARLLDIETYIAGKIAYLRFNYYTGDAAGQNMVSMATFTACSWILAQITNVRHFYMEANLATDKKCSVLNMMRTRGKRVVAEITIPRDIMIRHLRVDPETLDHLCRVGNLGAFMTGASNNALHAANALAAIFIATGQDVANIAESSAGMIYTEITPQGDLYGSFTLPSLIVATYGGGTGLPTQRECLEVLGCYGPGKVLKFAEIVAAVVGAGEISLAGALSSLDWVTSHERFGKNR